MPLIAGEPTKKTIAMEMQIEFIECEHNGDFENYASDLIECGAKIKDRHTNFDEETAIVVIEVNNKEEFVEKFKETDSFDFSSLY